MALEIKVKVPDSFLEGVKMRHLRGMTREEFLNSRISEEDSGCWHWHGEVTRNGYGRVKWGGKRYLTYRLIYEMIKGPVPEGLQLDHLCRNRLCVNPEHLEPVTISENIRRGEMGFGRLSGLCKNGLHDITDEGNIYLGGGRRTCYKCRRVSYGLAEERVRPKQKRVEYLN